MGEEKNDMGQSEKKNVVERKKKNRLEQNVPRCTRGDVTHSGAILLCHISLQRKTQFHCGTFVWAKKKTYRDRVQMNSWRWVSLHLEIPPSPFPPYYRQCTAVTQLEGKNRDRNACKENKVRQFTYGMWNAVHLLYNDTALRRLTGGFPCAMTDTRRKCELTRGGNPAKARAQLEIFSRGRGTKCLPKSQFQCP